MRVRSCFLTHR